MARQLRIQYDGAIYHLLSCGDRREEIFRMMWIGKVSFETLGVACEKTDWYVHAYCLMGNHFHLVVETPRANLVEGMKWLLGTYTMRFNRRHKAKRPSFRRPLQVIIDRRSDARPFAHGVRLCAFESGASQVGWKAGAIAKVSLEVVNPSYLRSRKKRESWLRCDRLFGEHGPNKGESSIPVGVCSKNGAGVGWSPTIQMRSRFRRGWSFGAEDFIARLLDRLPGSVTEHHHGRERNQTDEQRAEAMIAARLKKLGWAKSELAARRKVTHTRSPWRGRCAPQTTMS